MAGNDNRDEGSPAPDLDATQVNDSGPPDEYTEYQTRPGVDTATGFDRARQLARKAQSESGRLLKKRFVLEDVLGEGGMGLVYKARDLRKVEAEDRNPYIAVKVLGQQFKDHPQAFVSLQQEAVKSQKLAHPNIVTVHDFDREGNTIFMTMELLKGDPLDALIRLEAPFSRETALRYFRDMCAGLEYAHQRELIHSDFKPGNVFVTTGGTVKILDFGIARAASKNALSHDWDVGDLGALTPAYATQEMVKGEPPSASDDVYALACVLYLMLGAEHPYQGKSAADAEREKLKPARLDCLSNREWQALSAALSTDKSRRPATIAAFRDSLLPPARGATKKVLAGVGLLVLLAAGGLAYQQYSAGQERALAVQQRLLAARDCFIDEDFECAIENALVARNLSAQNSQASELLERARERQSAAAREAQVDRLLGEARRCLEGGDYGCTRVKASELLELEPGDERAGALLKQAAQASESEALATLLARAEACLDAGDRACATSALAEAARAGASAADQYPVQRRLDILLAQDAATRQAREAELNELLSEAESCLQRDDFSCGEARIAAALELEPRNTRAIELRQAMAAERQQKAFREQTAKGFLKEAEACLVRKDYSCSIAKSESALAIVPDYAAAKSVIERARAAQRKAKMNISIQ